jgi:hypothetical protein
VVWLDEIESIDEGAVSHSRVSLSMLPVASISIASTSVIWKLSSMLSFTLSADTDFVVKSVGLHSMPSGPVCPLIVHEQVNKVALVVIISDVFASCRACCLNLRKLYVFSLGGNLILKLPSIDVLPWS